MERLRPVAFYNNISVTSPCGIQKPGRAHNSRENLLESISCARCLGFASVQAVFELEERLANGVGERYTCGVYEEDGNANRP